MQSSKNRQHFGQSMNRETNEPVAWRNLCVGNIGEDSEWIYNEIGQGEPLYTHPAKTLTDEDIAKVVHELNQKANTPERWVTAMQIGAETIIQLRDELRKAQEK